MNTSRKKILILTPSLSRGGAEKQLLKIAVYLRDRGYNVKIVSLKPINGFGERLAESGLSVFFMKNWNRPLKNLHLLYRIVRDFDPAIVVSFMFVAIICARLLKFTLRFKLVSSIRISVLPSKWYLPFCMTAGDDAVVYNSSAAQLAFEQQFPRLKTGMVIHNDIAVPVLRTRKQGDDHVFTWVCIGHFRWNKDYVTLFNALARIKQVYRVLVIGELNGLNWPELMLNELGLEGKVKLMGFVDEPSNYLAEADGFVLSSFSEGMPNAVLEAMALEKPVVVTDIDGNRELIEGARCGLLSRPQDDRHLATQLLAVMDMGASERTAMGRRGRAYVEDHFNTEGVMQQWVKLLEQV